MFAKCSERRLQPPEAAVDFLPRLCSRPQAWQKEALHAETLKRLQQVRPSAAFHQANRTTQIAATVHLKLTGKTYTAVAVERMKVDDRSVKLALVFTSIGYL